MLLLKSSLVNQLVYCDYLNKYGWRVTYKKRDDSRINFYWRKPAPGMGAFSQKSCESFWSSLKDLQVVQLVKECLLASWLISLFYAVIIMFFITFRWYIVNPVSFRNFLRLAQYLLPTAHRFLSSFLESNVLLQRKLLHNNSYNKITITNNIFKESFILAYGFL